jgi:CheY-like chemotaxis protein
MTLVEAEVLEPLALTRKHTVVLVDDDAAVLSSLRRMLRAEPYDLVTTTRADEALDRVGRGDVSLIMVDQRMPEMCGTELAERVRRISPRTVRVMLTAYPGNAIVRHGLAQDLQWLVSKPWNDDALRLALRRLLRDVESVPRGPAEPDAGGALKSAVRHVAGTLARGTGWVLGFAWMADAGGSRTLKEVWP